MAERVGIRAVAGTLAGVVVGMTALLLALAAASSIDALPLRALVVRSGSMAPAIETGSVVAVRTVAPSTLRIGDVVTFRDPTGADRLITHRVRGLRVRGDRVRVTTKGDANTQPERWSVPLDGEVGLVRLRMERVGYALAVVQTRPGRLLVLVLPALLLCAFELRRIWRPAPGPAATAA